MTTRRLWWLTAVLAASLAAVYALVFLPGAWFRFDDFWQLNSSAVHAPPLLRMLTSANEADGRWQPGMRLIMWALGGAAGVDRAWPFYLAVLAGHAINTAMAVRLARLWGADAAARAASALIAVVGLNFSAFTIVSVCLLHNVVATTFILAAVASALAYWQRARRRSLIACVAFTLAGLLFREIAVVAPLLAVVCILTSAAAPRHVFDRRWTAIVAAFAVAGAGFLALSWLAGISIVPARGRYDFKAGAHVFRNLLYIAAHVTVWIAVPIAVLVGRGRMAAARQPVALAAGWAVVAMLPTLFLTWRSPGHLYLVLFGVAVAGGSLWTAADARRHVAAIGLAVMAAVVFAGVAGIAAQRDVLRWGPITKHVLDDWLQQRAPGDVRVIVFDADDGLPYGGLARLIGPGIRLREALEVASREQVADAAICVTMVIGPPYTAEPGDALFLHEGGRLRRMAAPPFRATCMQ